MIRAGRIPGASEPGFATQNSYIFYGLQKHSRAQVGVSWRKYWRKYGVSSYHKKKPRSGTSHGESGRSEEGAKTEPATSQRGTRKEPCHHGVSRA